MPVRRITVAGVLFAYLVVPVVPFVGTVGHEMVHRLAGQTASHGHPVGSEPGAASHHEHDDILTFLLSLRGDPEASHDPVPTLGGGPDVPRPDHVAPRFSGGPGILENSGCAGDRGETAPASLDASPPTPPPRPTA